MKSKNALQKERIDKLLRALWEIANDLPVNPIGLQNMAKNALMHDKAMYVDSRTKIKD